MMYRTRRRPSRCAIRRALTAAIVCALAPDVYAGRVLFDGTKSEMAGNADWVIDSDSELSGNSNPQRIPTPAQSGITATTPETYWKGGISAWGVTMVKHGNTVESLPRSGGRITYGDATNLQDLSHYKTYVVCEPNNLFTAAEKTAIVNFVAGGGGLFMVSDHTGSDRDNDGSDAVDVWNDLFTNNGVATNPFGMAVNSNSISQVSTNVNPTAFKNGVEGTATNLEFNAGATFTISPTANSSVRAAVWTTGSQTNSNAMMAYASYGSGRVVALGDSSPADDGTGDTGDTLYGGWSTGSNGVLISNASDWLQDGPQSTYDATTGGSWNTAASWTGKAANGDGVIADFKGNIASPSTVTLDGLKTVGLVRFDSLQPYTIAGPSKLRIFRAPPIRGRSNGIDVISGSHTILAPISLADGPVTFDVRSAASTLTFDKLTMEAEYLTFTKSGLGQMNFTSFAGFGFVEVTGGSIKSTGDLAYATYVANLTFKNAATFDLGKSGLIVDHYAPSASINSRIESYVATGQLFTSEPGRVIGYALASALHISKAGTFFVPSTALIFRPTYAGDANLDLTVNFDDLVPLAQNYNASGKTWSDGDFTNDGLVNFDDLVVLAQHYNASTVGTLAGDASFHADWTLAQALVPEPGAIAFATVATAFFSRRRR